MLSHKLTRHARLVYRTAGLSKLDHRSASNCRHTGRAHCSVSVEENVSETSTPPAAEHKPSFRAFLDFKALKADLDKHVQNCRDRNSNANPRKVAHLYDEFCEVQQNVEKIRNDRNANAKAMKASHKQTRVVPTAAKLGSCAALAATLAAAKLAAATCFADLQIGTSCL